MDDRQAPGKSRAQRRWFGWRDVIYLVVIGAGIFATKLPAKFRREVKEIVSPKPALATPSHEDIFRKEESKLLAEAEAKYQRDTAALKKLLEERVKQAPRENPPPVVSEIEIGAVTDVRKLRSGIPFKTIVNIEKGGIASKERIDEASYTASYQLALRVPIPATTFAELEAGNPELGKMLPGLPPLIAKAKVSDWFKKLYDNKVGRVRRDANTLNELLTKHNIYDCETILQFQGDSGRRVFFMQAEMDVVSDGSDGDRLPVMPEDIVNSPNYQPFTSYGWPKKTTTANPIIAGYERRIDAAQKELSGNAAADRKEWLRERVRMLKRGIDDLKARSFLIADYDPFIVIPVDILSSGDAFAPDIGDYAVVICGKKLYPAIVGDGGPTFKVGEASLRMAKEINPRASSYNRPVSDLKVGYLVFPGSHDSEKGPPDYEKWRQRCHDLLGEIGGVGEGYQLHQWQDLLPKVEPPAPTPPVTPVPDPNKPMIPPSGSPPVPPPGGSPAVPPNPQVPPPANPAPTSGGSAPGAAPAPR